MLVVQKAHSAGSWAISETAYAGMILVCAASCVIAPIVLRWLIRREGYGKSQQGEAGG
jgi:hypothetical protein